MKKLNPAAVVLAAGKSERMGTNKLLLEVGGRTILDRLLDALDASTVEEVYVVLGHRPEELRPTIETHGVEAVLNPDYEEGMTGSFKTGLRMVSADAVFLVLGDQLGLDVGLLERMTKTMASHTDALIVSPMHEGRRGHPVLFSRALFEEIMGLGKEEALRQVVDGHKDEHRLVEGGFWCTVDFDTPEEFERVREQFEAGLGASPR